MEKYLHQIKCAVKDIEQQMRTDRYAEQDRRTYVIWRHLPNSRISDLTEVIGLFTGTYEEADILIYKLNATDPDVTSGRCRGYYRTEPAVMNAAYVKDMLEVMKQ